MKSFNDFDKFTFKVSKYDIFTQYELYKNDEICGNFDIHPVVSSVFFHSIVGFSKDKYEDIMNYKTAGLDGVWSSMKGVGTKLLLKAISESKKKGYEMIVLRAVPGELKNLDRLISFYQKFGFKVLYDERKSENYKPTWEHQMPDVRMYFIF